MQQYYNFMKFKQELCDTKRFTYHLSCLAEFYNNLFIKFELNIFQVV